VLLSYGLHHVHFPSSHLISSLCVTHLHKRHRFEEAVLGAHHVGQQDAARVAARAPITTIMLGFEQHRELPADIGHHHW
jgi:hypothetical protein